MTITQRHRFQPSRGHQIGPHTKRAAVAAVEAEPVGQREHRPDVGFLAPDRQVLLDVPAALAAERAEHRANTEADRAKDAYERDGGLQRRTGRVYSELAANAWGGRWLVAGPDTDGAALAVELGK